MPAETPVNWVSSVITLATTGGFGALLWYFVVKHIPSIESRHQEERNEWRAYLAQRDSDQKERDEKLAAVIESFETTLREIAQK